MRTSFQHQPEAQHPNFQLSTSWQADYPIFKGRLWKVPQAFRGERVAIRPLAIDGRYGIFFGAHQIANIDLTSKEGVGDVSEQVSVMSPG
jgi:putative transposase